MREIINIYDYTNTNIAETMELGDKVYEKLEPLIKDCLRDGKKIVIDFSQITSLTTKFLNNAIGKLFLSIEVEVLLNNITFIGLDVAKKTTLKWSLDTSINRAKIKNDKNTNAL